MPSKKVRVVIAKPGLDGHDRGANVVAQGLRDAGMEVIYLGLRVTPEQIAEAAIQEDADVVGLSCLSGAHMALFPKTVALTKEKSDKDILFLGGGIIPRKDVPKLKAAGIAQTFGPGTPIVEIINFIKGRFGGKMITKINHIGIAVTSIDEVLKLYTEVLGLKLKDIEVVVEQKVKTALIPVGESMIELIESTDPEGTIAKFIESRGEGLHHLALEVDNIEQALATMVSKGVALIDAKPRGGVEKTRVAFLHPRGTRRVLLELVES